MLITSIFIPIRSLADFEIFARVSSVSFIPLRFSEIFSLTSSDNILPVAAIDKLFLASSLSIRSLKPFKVSSECL